MRTVLLIEDHLEVASLLRQLIARCGHRALMARNLAEAEQIWSESKSVIDLLLTDNSLPDGSGIRFAELLALEKPGLKVIVSSGIPSHELPPGFQRIDKPFKVQDFLKTIQQALPEPLKADQ